MNELIKTYTLDELLDKRQELNEQLRSNKIGYETYVLGMRYYDDLINKMYKDALSTIE